MSNQKVESKFRIREERNFKNANDYKQYLAAQVHMQNGKEITKVKGASRGGQIVLSTQIRQSYIQDNKTQKKQNIVSIKEITNNTNQIIIESFKSMKLQKFDIVYKDQIIQQPQILKKHNFVNQESLEQYKNQQFTTCNQIGTLIKKKETKNFKNPKSQALQNNKLQLDLTEYQKNQEKEQLLKQIEFDNQIFKQQNEELQKKNIRYIENQRIMEQQISMLNQQIEQENTDITRKKEILQKKINVLTKSIEKIQFNIVKVDLNFDESVNIINKKYNELDQMIESKTEEIKLFQSSQIHDKSKKVISRRHNFELFKTQLNSQPENQIQCYKQEKQKLDQEYKDKLKFSQQYKTDLQAQLDQQASMIKTFAQEIININAKEDSLHRQLRILKLQQQQFEKTSLNTQEQIQQSKEEFEQKMQDHQGQLTNIEKQLNQIREQMKYLENQKQQVQNINQEICKTEYQITMNNLENNAQPKNDFIEIYKNSSHLKGIQSQDEIVNQEQKTIMALVLNSIIYFTTNKKINSPYQTKWITQESLQSEDFLNSDRLIIIEQSLQDLNYITSDQINGFAEKLQIKDQALYFRLPKKFRQSYPRLYILPTSFLEEFRLYYKQNKDQCINLIVNYFEDFSQIQYQFWLIYQKISFIIKENSLYYVVVVHLNNRLLIIYNSIPKPQQQYEEIVLCLNYLFTQLLKEQIQFDVHVSPSFPIQKDQNNANHTSYYACIALEHYSRNQAIKDYLDTQKIQAEIEKIKLKQIKSPR